MQPKLDALSWCTALVLLPLQLALAALLIQYSFPHYPSSLTLNSFPLHALPLLLAYACTLCALAWNTGAPVCCQTAPPCR